MSDEDPVGWALLRVKEAQALRTLSFERAEQAYRDALTVFRREDHPVQWYSVSLMLATLMVIHWPADMVEPPLRQAVAILAELSSAADAAPNAQTRAMAAALEARALTELTKHDPASYEAACQAQRATAAVAQDVLPRVSADARLALAELLIRHGGSLDEATAVLEQALTFYAVDEHPEAWLRCHWYLGSVLEALAVSGQDLVAARAQFESGLTVKPPRVEAALYAQACHDMIALLTNSLWPKDYSRVEALISWCEECLTYEPADNLASRMLHAEVLAKCYLTRGESRGASPDNADLIHGVALLDQAAAWARESGAPAERTIGLAHDAAVARTTIGIDRRQNLEIAIGQLTELLDQYESRAARREDRAAAQVAGNHVREPDRW